MASRRGFQKSSNSLKKKKPPIPQARRHMARAKVSVSGKKLALESQPNVTSILVTLISFILLRVFNSVSGPMTSVLNFFLARIMNLPDKLL